jgi:hypothetical protein
MLKSQQALSHMIIVGPPGSGKTTSARFLVEQMHGKNGFGSFFSRALFLNSSDERGLEAVRSRVFPFVRSNLHSILNLNAPHLSYVPPKIIVFDEAETLTDQAQIALRPLLDSPPSEVLLIFLCNSISRIHFSILHKFLTIQLEAPHPNEFKARLEKIHVSLNTQTSGLDILFRRGDIRFFLLHPQKHSECAMIWMSLFTKPIQEVKALIEKTLQTWIFPELALFFLVLCQELGYLTTDNLSTVLRMTDSDFLRLCPSKVRTQLLSSWVDKNLLQKVDSPLGLELM